MNYTKLGNNIHIIADDLERKKFEIEIVYSSGGSWFEAKKDRGKKHLMEHCIVSRSKTLNFKEFQDFQFSQNLFFNAFTSTTSMGLSGTSHYKDFELITKLLLEQAIEPTFDKQILDQEREIVLREISERSGDPNYRLHYDLMAKIFTKESYENHQVLGNAKMVQKTTEEDLQILHSQNLEKSHLIISLVGGNKDKKEVKSLIEDFFKSNNGGKFDLLKKEKDRNPLTFRVANKFNSFNFLPVVHKLAHSHVDMHLYIPFEVSFDLKPTLKVFDELFLNYYGVLYNKLRNEKGLIYSLYSSFQISTKCLYLNLSCEEKHVKEILNLIEETFSDFEKTFLQAKLETLLKIVKKKIEMSKDSPWSEASSTYDNLVNYGEVEGLDGFLARISKIDKKDIQKVYTKINEGLKNKRVIIVSNQKSILKL